MATQNLHTASELFTSGAERSAYQHIIALNMQLTQDNKPPLSTATFAFYRKPASKAAHVYRHITSAAYRTARPTMAWLEEKAQLGYIRPLTQILRVMEGETLKHETVRVRSNRNHSHTEQRHSDSDDSLTNPLNPMHPFSIHPLSPFNHSSHGTSPRGSNDDDDSPRRASALSQSWNNSAATECDTSPSRSVSSDNSYSYDSGSSYDSSSSCDSSSSSCSCD